MFQIRIHGRGGQGVVTAAEVLPLSRQSRTGILVLQAESQAHDHRCHYKRSAGQEIKAARCVVKG